MPIYQIVIFDEHDKAIHSERGTEAHMRRAFEAFQGPLPEGQTMVLMVKSEVVEKFWKGIKQPKLSLRDGKTASSTGMPDYHIYIEEEA